MKKANFTFRFFEQCLSTILVVVAIIFSPALANACELSCGGKQQVSLDENCEADITAQMILSDDGASCPDGVFTVIAKLTMNGAPIAQGPTALLDGTYINQDIIIEIEADDNGSINRCWGVIVLEDKLAPTIECDDITVSCSADNAPAPTFENIECGTAPIINLISQSPDRNLCTDDFLKEYDQTFTATDAQGNTSENPCTRTVTIQRIDTDAIIFPANLRVSTANALACDGDYPRLEPGSIIPDPSFSGVPSLDGVNLLPALNFNCNTVVTYNDLVLPEVGCVTKVMRTFTISEWVCGIDEITEQTQIIEIVDDQGPEIAALNDISISTTTGFECQAAYLLPQIQATDNCKEVSSIDISYPGGFIEDYDGSELITLNVGENVITATAYDACLNSSSETFTVFVADNNAPVAVCDQNTVVSLSSNPNGLTSVSALSFDDGSYDECGLANPAMSVKRMDNGAACGIEADEFSSAVQFCCSDLGTNAIVIFRVTDQAGNTNECMVNVEVQDKLTANITAPNDTIVECDFPFELSEAGLIAAFGDATAVDNCGAGTDEIIRSFYDATTSCNTGILTRYFSIPDANGGFKQVSQNITFVNDDAFDVVNDVEWPADVTLNSCLPLSMGMATENLPEVSPDVTGRPALNEDACDMVGIDYDDMVFEIFNASSTSCFKIIRTFTVADWCEDARSSYQQVIMVINTVAPTLELSCDAITECTFDGECADGNVTLRMAASDDCTPASALAWQYSIDLNNDGSLDTTSLIQSGSEIDSIGDKEVSIIDATGDYPIGSHRIIWTVEDKCGNLTRCEQLFTVESCKTPTPYCYNGLAIEIMSVDTDNDNVPDAGMIEIWASDFDAGSFHGCGYDVTVSFSPDPADANRTYTCADIGQQDVEIWATATLPDGSLVQDFCSSFINIQDNLSVCPGFSGEEEEEEEENALLNVGGTIATESNESIEQVSIEILNQDMVAAQTDADGYYLFDNMKTGGNYVMHPSMDVDHLNGVSTIDLVLIQRHILGLGLLDSPYKIVAADINNDGKLTAADLLGLRKTILGIAKGFNGNESWRFVDRNYQFIDAVNPLTEKFRESYDINNLNSDMNIDFVGVKVGDVNGTVVANQRMNATVRSNKSLDFSINSTFLKAGSVVEIPVYANNFDNIIAYQFSMELSDKLEFVSVKGGALEMSDVNFGTIRASEGIITTSWDNYQGSTVAQDEPLFYITANVKEGINVSNALAFTSTITKAEAYSADDVLEVNLETRSNPNTGNEFVLYQNTPNPFQGYTTIKFELSQDEAAALSVFDVTGKLIQSITGDYIKGENYIELNTQDLGANGVLYYTLQTEDHTATKKMVVIK
ncbi:T9SS type A sorting domain-containing protein [Portibacter lacus]|uniref:Dockerin domain-containing protein n=1 Tax=Portibacter lacus TaxID=1099794 RepID=A0AA37SPB0_9BACT|nr:T9SS type A sorting domain-containing protein [Portibacter lacus]GLR16719.1 hypothetical protein GCM10007940_13340 [Portibacter lacus]